MSVMKANCNVRTSKMAGEMRAQLSVDSFHTLASWTVESLKTFYALTAVGSLFYGITS
jgi:hypothetical protein